MNLAVEMAKLSEPPNNSAPPMWNYWRHDLWQRAQEDDARNFTKWPCIYHTMLVEHWADIVKKYEYPYVLQGGWEPNTPEGHNLVHQAYHILRWQDATGLRIADMKTVYEFGGGYGAMALVCNRLGFQGKYYIYDLPEFSLLQRWYLEECGISNVEWATPAGTDLLIACYSLSETTMEERDEIFAHVPANSYLLLYSAMWEAYNNRIYFESLGDWMEDVSHWRHERIEHLPPESWYTWGW